MKFVIINRKGGVFMYDVTITVTRIKAVAKEKDVNVTSMLEELGMNKNTLNSMTNRGSWLSADRLAKIADYLHTSVDYLLGRSDNLDDFSSELREIKHIFETLSVRDKAELMTMIFEFSDKKRD